MLRIFVGEMDAYELLTRAVKMVWGMNALPAVERTEGGKPFFRDYPHLHFSLSHSGALVLCALSDAPVGADLEMIRPRKEKLPAYTFRGADYERYLALGGDWNAFYTLWTEVESIIKYTGEGLKAYRRAVLPKGCVISNLSGEDWRAALCAHEQAEQVEFME